MYYEPVACQVLYMHSLLIVTSILWQCYYYYCLYVTEEQTEIQKDNQSGVKYLVSGIGKM